MGNVDLESLGLDETAAADLGNKTRTWEANILVVDVAAAATRWTWHAWNAFLVPEEDTCRLLVVAGKRHEPAATGSPHRLVANSSHRPPPDTRRIAAVAVVVADSTALRVAMRHG